MNRGFFPGIQILRGVAAILVLLCHLVWQFSEQYAGGAPIHEYISLYGNIGVDIFFVISGFVIFYTSFSKTNSGPPIGSFLWKRLTRIFPLYWVVYGIMCLVYLSGKRSGDYVTATSIFWDFFLVPQSEYETTVPVSWTLSLEIIFYAIFAGCLLLRSRRQALVGASAGLILLAVLGAAVPALLANDITIVVEFMFGMIVAELFISGKLKNNFSLYWLIPPIFLTLSVIFLYPPILNFDQGLPGARVMLWGLPSAIMIALVLKIQPGENAGFKLLLLLGNASYAIYLTHYFFVYAIESFFRRVSPPESLIPALEISTIVIAIAVGVGVYKFIDKPLQRLFSRSNFKGGYSVSAA